MDNKMDRQYKMRTAGQDRLGRRISPAGAGGASWQREYNTRYRPAHPAPAAAAPPGKAAQQHTGARRALGIIGDILFYGLLLALLVWALLFAQSGDAGKSIFGY